MTVVFHDEKFYRDLNAARARRNITWNKVATRSGTSPTSLNSFIRNFEGPKHPDGKFKGLNLENVLKLMHWLGESDISKYSINEDELDRVRNSKRAH